MKTLIIHSFPRLLLTIVAIILFFAALQKVSAMDDGCAVAMSINLSSHEKSAWSHAEDYALELYDRFCTAGGEAHYIVYESRQAGIGSTRHAFIAYRDSKGQYWAMDNRRARPCWLMGTTPAEWLKSFSTESSARMVECVSDLAFAGRSVYLHRPAGGNVLMGSTAPDDQLAAK